ncbi:hypothetical protein BsIDN1_18690 [Bacillus safensis]|uniref:Peptidase M20 dimerisation domain-containing protein n=1 Tax=Bacillus safensis TaxID=561879 RepID=A0A5S9M5P6_BACIA|nr:hypothetical protein BsIDN1_18690 [Bacillus safensis]
MMLPTHMSTSEDTLLSKTIQSRRNILLASQTRQTEGVTEVKEAETQMGGEDFAYYLQHVPGTFFYTGAMPENSQDVYPHHHPKFDINEKAMPIAAKVLANAVLSYNE